MIESVPRRLALLETVLFEDNLFQYGRADLEDTSGMEMFVTNKYILKYEKIYNRLYYIFCFGSLGPRVIAIDILIYSQYKHAYSRQIFYYNILNVTVLSCISI